MLGRLERRPRRIGERTPHCAEQNAGAKPAYEKVGWPVKLPSIFSSKRLEAVVIYPDWWDKPGDSQFALKNTASLPIASIICVLLLSIGKAEYDAIAANCAGCGSVKHWQRDCYNLSEG
jgi:hypothetical protein